MTKELKNIIEAVLLVADSALSVSKIQNLFDQTECPNASEIKDALTELMMDYKNRGIELRKIGSAYRFQTREKYAAWIRKLHAVRPPRMSRALLETLAVIAYRQPATRGDIEEVRGVGVSSEIMQRLLERGWIKQVGVRDVPGQPALFGTTAEFLAYFNLASLKHLPDLMPARNVDDIATEMGIPLPTEFMTGLHQTDEGQNDPLAESEDDRVPANSFGQSSDESMGDIT